MKKDLFGDKVNYEQFAPPFGLVAFSTVLTTAINQLRMLFSKN